MAADKVAPVLRTFIINEEWPGYRPHPRHVAHAKRELRALLAVARAAQRDPDKHHLVEAALARLARASRGTR